MSTQDFTSPLPPRKLNLTSLDASGSDDNFDPSPSGPETSPISNNTETVSSPIKAKQKISIKKYLPILGIILLIPLIVILIFKVIIPGISGKPSGGEVTVTYWGLWEDSSVLQSLIDEFEANNPGIKINYIHNQKTNYRTRLAGRLAKDGDESGQLNEVPDIFRIHSSWVPSFRQNLANVPSEILKAIEMESDYYGAFKKDLKQGNNYIGIPLMYDQLALFYNKDLLDAAQKNPPRTWWGLRDTAKQLTVKDAAGRISIAGASLGTVENINHWSDILGLMMKQNNIDLSVKDEANKKKLQDILTFYTIFRTTDQVWDESLAESTEQFANGKLAFYFGPSWRVFNIEDMNKDLRFEVTNVPQLPTLEGLDPTKVESGEIEGNLTSDQWATYWFEGVNNRSKHQKEAWKFLEFLSSKSSLEKFYTAASQIRSFGEIYPRKSMADSLEGNLKVKPFVAGADNGSSWYMSSRTFDEGVNDEMSKYFADAINGILNNNQKAEEVITPLQNGIDQIINKHKITKKLSE